MRALAFALTLLATPALSEVRVESPLLRTVPAGAPVAAGYVSLTNKGNDPVTFTGVDAALAERIEIHEMVATEASDMMRMREVEDGLVIAPGETVRLAPDGLHLMIFAPKAEIAEGSIHPMVLLFDGAEPVEVEFEGISLMKLRKLGRERGS